MFCTEPLSCFGSLILIVSIRKCPGGGVGLPQVIQLCSPYPPDASLYQIYARYCRAVQLEPHLYTSARQLVSEEKRRINTAPSDIHEYTSKGLVLMPPDLNNVAWSDCILISS